MSPRKSDVDRRLDAIEALVCRDVGRGTQALIEANRGGLRRAAEALCSAGSIGLMTGFFVPRAAVPAAETDGPVGTALLAAALAACGLPVRVAVDEPCARAVRVALDSVEPRIATDVVRLGRATDIIDLASEWKHGGLTHVVAVERCGRAADGRPHNMRGVDVSAWTAPLEDLFLAGPWTRLAVGDGGNEIGMGRLPKGLVAGTVPNGAEIACVVSCDHLVVAGVSNWGAYGLMAALAVLRPDWRGAISGLLSAEQDLAVTRAIVEQAGAVDGVTALPQATVDGFGPEIHGPLIAELRRIAHGEAEG